MTVGFDPNTCFRVHGAQNYVPFHKIPPGTMIHHKHEGRMMEEYYASAKTWKNGRTRGFFCFKYLINYVATEEQD